ncbi:MAG: hypothetical protein M4579_007172 [Chaenotheca gracillima]|nr:MAG: hypothetical protein M4579_007172 [Chaenotheca gracillima]
MAAAARSRGGKSAPGSSSRSVPARLQAAVPLSRPCCLRCSKQYSTQPGLSCLRKQGSTKCTRCVKLGKKCDKVPARYNRRLNAIQELATSSAADGDINSEDSVALRESVRKYKATVESFLRSQKAPRRTEEAILDVLKEISASLSALVDVRRYEARLPPLPVEDEDEWDDEDDADMDVETAGAASTSAE